MTDIASPRAQTQPDRRRWYALAVIVAAQFMVVLDVAIVNVALPSIKTDLHFSQESLQWVVTAYSIMFGGVLLLGGRMADLLGRRRLFMAGLALFTASSLLDGLAWSEGSLIAFRVLQGLGGGMLMPAGMTILTRAAGPQRVGRVMSIIGVPMLLGPIVGTATFTIEASTKSRKATPQSRARVSFPCREARADGSGGPCGIRESPSSELVD